jgi:hypothetical protein
METMKLRKRFKCAPSPENILAIPGGVFNFVSMGHETEGRHALVRISTQGKQRGHSPNLRK